MEQLLTVEQLQALHASEPTKPDLTHIDVVDPAGRKPERDVQHPDFQRQSKAAASVKEATGPQIAFLWKLVRERTPEVSDEYVESVIAEGSRRVSVAIDLLLMKPVVAPQTKRQALDMVPRTNKFAGRCTVCKTKVEAEAGTLSKSDDGKWEVEHRTGECPANDFPFPLGRYAVDTDEGHLAFYVATLDGLYVQASDDLHRVAVNAQEGIIAKIAADPEEASTRYGKELGQCGRCGKTLTSEWRLQGIGPVCSQKDWA